MQISNKDARHIILNAQKLLGPTKACTLEIIKHLGHVQIDTISVVERAHHHTLWSRNPSYKKEELETLLEKRNIFEYWSHAASYLPIETYRYSLPRMQEYQTVKGHWFKVDKKVKNLVLETIKKEGPKKAIDFKSPRKKTGWFDWAPAKKALEQLFMEGTLMTTKREGFHKVYDLKENVLPRTLNVCVPTEKEFAQFFILNQLESLGLASLNEITYQRGNTVKALVQETLEELISDNKVIRINIENNKMPYYLKCQTLEILNNKTPATNDIHILSPFDNLVIQRKRLKSIFDFDYQIECYVPEKKRKFGYFCLPLLKGDQFFGRLDAKASRKTKKLEIKNIFFEKGHKNKIDQTVWQEKLMHFAKFNQCHELTWSE